MVELISRILSLWCGDNRLFFFWEKSGHSPFSRSGPRKIGHLRSVVWAEKILYSNDLWPGPCWAGRCCECCNRLKLVDFCCGLDAELLETWSSCTRWPEAQVKAWNYVSSGAGERKWLQKCFQFQSHLKSISAPSYSCKNIVLRDRVEMVSLCSRLCCGGSTLPTSNLEMAIGTWYPDTRWIFIL
jgi:hypothetical protein